MLISFWLINDARGGGGEKSAYRAAAAEDVRCVFNCFGVGKSGSLADLTGRPRGNNEKREEPLTVTSLALV